MSKELELLKSQLICCEIEDIEYSEDDEPVVFIFTNGDRLKISTMSDSISLLAISLTTENGIETINL